MRIVRVVLSCSFVLGCCLAIAGQYSELQARLAQAKTPAQKIQILDTASIQDPAFAQLVGDATEADPKAIENAEAYVKVAAVAESGGAAPPADATIKKIKSSRLYADEGAKEQANWLSGAIRRLQNIFSRKEREPEPVSSSGPAIAGFPSFIIYFVWFLLGAAILAFIVYALRFVSFGKLRKRRAKAMLEDDEPERTLDEWLSLADDFEGKAMYREAVRSLYLACLLKFDERNIARFLRGQTNWEHLARIDSSPRKPAGLDFREPTRAFDRIWYGHQVRGPEDVADFRRWYSNVCEALREAAA